MDYDDYDYGYERGVADADDAAGRYIDQLERMYQKDIEELSRQLREVTVERDQLKEQLAIAAGMPSEMIEKVNTQLRHV